MTDNQAVERLPNGALSDPEAERLVVRVAMDDAELARELEAYLLACSSEGAEPDRWQYLEPHEQEALATKIAANIGYRLVSDLSPQPQGGGEDIAKAFLAGSRFTETGYGNDAEGALRAYLNGNIPGDDDEFAADLFKLRAIVAGAPKADHIADAGKMVAGFSSFEAVKLLGVLDEPAPKAPVEGEEDLMAAFGELPHKLVGIAQHLDIERGPDWQGRRETLLTAAGEMTRLEGVLKSPIAVRLNILRGSIADPALSTPSPRVSVEEIAEALRALQFVFLLTAAKFEFDVQDSAAYRDAEEVLARLSPAQEGEGQ